MENLKGCTRGFINIVSRRATGFHRQAKLFEPNFFITKTICQMAKEAGEKVLTAGQFAQCSALSESLECPCSCLCTVAFSAPCCIFLILCCSTFYKVEKRTAYM